MSDNKSFQQRIKKFQKFITKVKEKTQNVFHDEENKPKSTITRRHSSYIHQPTPIKENNINFFDNSRLKQEDHHDTILSHSNKLTNDTDNMITPTSIDTTSALSPPPRHLKKDKQKSLNRVNYQNRFSSSQIAVKPCLSRSNTLGHHPTVNSSTSSIMKYTATPDISSTFATTLSTPIQITNHTSFSSSNSSSSECRYDTSNNDGNKSIPTL